ncbi:TPA: hypothetical protein ACH3X3_003842 [Trebouxia sp. C0006]
MLLGWCLHPFTGREVLGDKLSLAVSIWPAAMNTCSSTVSNRVSTYVYGKLVELLFPSHSSTTTQLAMRYPHNIHSVIFHVPKDITQKSRSSKTTCKWCEPWQHYAVCLSVKTVRGASGMVAHAEHDHGFWACSFLFWFWGLDATCVYQLQTTPLLQALCMCKLVADGGPAHHWQAAHRHGQSRLQPDELCSYTLSHKPSKELMWSVVHNNSSSKASLGGRRCRCRSAQVGSVLAFPC